MPKPPPEPTELIYPSGDSWAPILVAAGLALAVAGVFTGWFWSVIGAVFFLGGLLSWWKRSDDEISRMRREQPVETAVIPAEPIRRATRGES
jgi:hypothetical protein